MAPIVVTDLDGTLLDHHTYAAGPAGPAVDALQQAGVVVVCASAKTRAEQQVHRAELGIAGPFIVENGAAVHADDGSALVVLGLPYAEVRGRLGAAADELGVAVRGFGDMSVHELTGRTGLAPDAAARAQAREHTEAFVVVDGDVGVDDLRDALGDQGLHLQRGARFWTASGHHDKGLALARVRTVFGEERGAPVTVHAIGDTHNDAAMLDAADVAWLVQRADGTWADLDVAGLVRLPGVGPAGWCLMADRILADLGQQGSP